MFGKVNLVGRLFSICLVLFVWAIVARPATLTVGGTDGQFQTIQEAISKAHEGEIVQVHSGTYYGNLTLNKAIILQGIDWPVLRGGTNGSVVVVTADGCSVKGFVIEHSGSDLETEDSGILLKSNGNRIEGNELRDVLYGIYFFSSRGNLVRGNTIRGRADLEVGERGAGLHLWNSPENTIEDNTISDARDGMYIQSCNGNQIRRNRVTNLRYGLHYMFSDNNVFEDNFFSNNVAGAAIMYSNNIEFRHNAFVHNRGFSSFGILFQECNDLLAEDNFVVDNAIGIFMEALRKTTFRHNVIAENDVAMQMFSSSDENTFTENNFVENLSPMELIGKSTTTRWSRNGRGNYWSDYDGYDLNEDGTGDVPHRVQNVFEYMEGNHPRLRVYLESPAASALALAERTFPVIRGSQEIDPAPLTRAVELRYPFVEERHKPRTQLAVSLISLAMFVGGVTVMWRSHRRVRSL